MAEPQICDGCERSRPGCVSVGEEVLCAECILARASSAQEAVLALWEAATYHWGEEAGGEDATTLRDLLFDSSVAYPGQSIRGKVLYGIGEDLGILDHEPSED